MCVWRTKINSSKRLRRNLLAKVHICLFVCRQNNRGWGRNEGGIGVLLCMTELEVHSFPIAKQLLCLPGFWRLPRLRAISVVNCGQTSSHPFHWVISLLCAVDLKPQLPRSTVWTWSVFGCSFNVVVELIFNNSWLYMTVYVCFIRFNFAFFFFVNGVAWCDIPPTPPPRASSTQWDDFFLM